MRLRGARGQAVLEFEGDTLGALRLAVAGCEVGCAVEAQELRVGHPPAVVEGEDGTLLEAVGVASGDTVLVREREGAAASGLGGLRAPVPVVNPNDDVVDGVHVDDDDDDAMLARAIAASLEDVGAGAGGLGGVLVRRVVADDNACLFNALTYAWAGARADGAPLREAVAASIRKDPVTFNEGFLGKSPEAYCRWILDPDHWGGAIELFALAAHLGVEIAAYDATSNREDVYGQGEGHAHLVMLVYDGIHYDALAVAPRAGAPERDDTTRFAVGPEAEHARQLAAAYCAKLHAERRFTNTASFTLRCAVCRLGLRGEREATEHARATGHAKFEEYSS